VNEEVVRAAGGIVIRRSDGTVDVLLVHRPRYGDWSFPKGKLHEGERDVDAAIREVREETGCECRVGEEVGRVRYLDRYGRDKEVVYFHMTPGRCDPFEPNDEVDEVRWVGIDAARALLTWSRDVALLRRAVDA
jgi:8-oxo-dGTP diphosphatase